MGKRWQGSAAGAIGKNVHFDDVYFNSTPQSHADAFSYLYSRLDDHRFYWWKLQAARHAIALYRSNRQEFTRQWEALLPGRARESVWYPDFDAEVAAPDL